jgi:flagellar biosynthetic protein FlhB
MASNKTEKATPKRREDARKKGQMARGPKLPAALGFMAALLVMRITGNDWLFQAKQIFASITSHLSSAHALTAESAHKTFIEAGWALSLLTLPVLASVMVASIAGNFLQDGFSLTPNALAPKLERLNPIANLKRIFSSKTVIEFFKSFIELSIVGAVCYGVLTTVITSAPTLVGSPASQTIGSIGELLYELGIRIGGVLILFAMIDYGYKWYTHQQSMKMSKQDIKDEYRSQEGDPMAKGQRRRAARALVQRRLTVEVPRADVVITNPTHYAVALLYDHKKSPAPMVVAKGADLMAKRIREIARANDVTIVENPPLARALYRDVEAGQSIPPELFRAVAEVLAYVYRQRQTYQK